MFVYLSKKIAIPNGTRLQSIAWNNDQGWIACGGEDGLLKVLKLEQAAASSGGDKGSQTDLQKKDGGASGAAAAPASSNLTMNQTLEGHSGAVTVSTWNMQHRKLTTSDAQGLIIVWILYKGVWYEEMINNRNKSVVADMNWNREGQKICIVYEDGAVIVGSVDGNRLWGKDLKNILLSHVQWSPDSKNILFATSSGELQMYDSNGDPLYRVNSYCNEGGNTIKVVALEWYNGLNGYIEPRVPCLAIAFENGKIQIMRDEKDTIPIIVDTNIKGIKMKWNNNGTLLAVSGVQMAKNSQGEEKEISIVQFYDPYGQYQRFLKVPGKRVSSISWEHNGLRLALAVDSFIYFANIRPDYKWTYFSAPTDVMVYTYNRIERSETVAVFWNTKSGERFTKFLSKIYFILSAGDCCLLVTRVEDSTEEGFLLHVCNAIGTPVETKQIDFEPKSIAMNKTHVYVSNGDFILDWQFRTSANLNANSSNNPNAPNKEAKFSAIDALRQQKQAKDRAFHIDNVQVLGTPETSNISDLKKKGPTSDPVVSMASSETILIVIRASGVLHVFNLQGLVLEFKFNYLPSPAHTSNRPSRCALNCDSSKLLILDANGVLKMINVERKSPSSSSDSNRVIEFERKEVWDLKWSEDNPEFFVIMEKTKMYVFKNTEPEDPVPNSGYVCSFADLQIKVAAMDEILKDPDVPNKDAISDIETKALRDTRAMVSQVGLADSIAFIESNPHPKLWKLVADASLETMDLEVCQKAFIRSGDYQGLQLVKKLKKLDDRLKQKAEIAAHTGNYDLAEKYYLEMDRKDLAIDLRVRLGDWFRVVQLIKSGGGASVMGGSGADDAVLEKAWRNIGEYYYDRQRWVQAVTYFAQGRDMNRLAECYYLLEDYDGMEKLLYSLADNSPLLKIIAAYFSSVGMCDQAVAAYVKAGDIKSAIDACVYLNQWNTAIELAKVHKFREIESLLAKYASVLLEKGKILSAIELYRKANYCQKSAKLLMELAQKAARQNIGPLKIKKIYVLAALEVEHHNHLIKTNPKNAEILQEERKGMSPADLKFMENPWRGAEAYHFYLLAQRQYYSGNLDAALKSALHLRNYEDIIDVKIVYSLLSIIALTSKHYSTCSKAFIKLEGLSSDAASSEQVETFENIALNIFTRFSPVDPPSEQTPCTNCGANISDIHGYCPHCHINFPVCIASGRPIIEFRYFICLACKHRAIESEIRGYSCCPLCHTTL